ANGNNDGTSWTNAYTNLQDALASPNGAIWVATGLYITGDAMADSTAVFEINTSLSIYGGFVGTEIMLDERDPEENETILSADLLGDDIEGDFGINRADNSNHVMAVTEGITSDVVIDGLIFTGGNTSTYADSDQYFRSGGGIHALSPIQLNTCYFVYNFGRAGGSVYLGGGASNSTITNCVFDENSSNSQSAGIFIDNLTNVSVNESFFINNLTSRGAYYALRGSGHEVSNCEFSDNINESGFGGALFNWNSQNFTLSNCLFEGNRASSAGAIYADGRELDALNPNEFLMSNCIFDDNATNANSGGSVYNSRSSMTITDCEFMNTNTPGSGGFLFQTGESKIVNISNCSFENAVISGWGGAMTCYGLNTTYNVSDCTFMGNTSSNLGGAAHCGFTAIANFENCTFEANNAASGGGLSAQNDSTEIHVVNSIFISNGATNSGGGIFAGTTESSSIVSVDGCEFQANSANFGAGIFLSENGDDDISMLELHNSLFIFNVADSQAGAVNLNDANGNISNCVFTNNIAVDPGVGGAISTNASSTNDVTISILNSTFSDNSGAFAAGISQWMENDSGSLVMTLQNNIFQNAGENYVIENGMPTVISNGGNLDESGGMIVELTQPSDIFGEDPEFFDASNFDYHLTEDSPCIDAGVTDGAPTTDIEGNMRDGMVDIGAYEFDIIESVDGEIIANNGALKTFPNPVANDLQLTLDNNWTADLTVKIFNNRGQEVQTLQTAKFEDKLALTIPVSTLSTGAYYLTISNGTSVVVERMMKK
ncbi:MAG: hypothetical protein ACI920_004127, partial [Saprospiraceae bacterium]